MDQQRSEGSPAGDDSNSASAHMQFLVVMCSAVLEALQATRRSRDVRYRHGWLPLKQILKELKAVCPFPSPLPRTEEELQLAVDAYFIHPFVLRDSHPLLFGKLCGMRPSHFMKLLDLVAEAIEGQPTRRRQSATEPTSLGVPLRESAAGSQPEWHSNLGRRHRQDPACRLFTCLRRLRTGDTFAYLEEVAGVAPSSICQDFWHVLAVIDEVLSPLFIRWPSAERRKILAMVCPGFRGLIGFIDVTEVKVRRPGRWTENTRLFSGKKGANTIVIQLIVDPFGNPISIDGGYGGHLNDHNTFSYSAIGRAVFESPSTSRGYFGDAEYLAGDCGYVDADRAGRVLTPYPDRWMTPPNAPLPKVRRIFSNLLRQYRVIVEYFFGLVRNKWRIFDDRPFPGKPDRILLAFRACACLTTAQLQWNGAQIRDQLFYDREELTGRDWEGKYFADECRATPLVREMLNLVHPQNMYVGAIEIRDRIAAVYSQHGD